MNLDNIIPDLTKFIEVTWLPVVEVGLGLIIGPWIKKLIWKMAKRSQEKGLITFLGSAANITIITFSMILAAEALGIRMNSVVSLLSALGLGVALALKGNMANVAGGLQILVTKPFKVGDYVRIAPHKGVVTAIEIMFVTIRTDNGKEVIIPNSSIIDDMVINYSKLPYLRIRTPFEVPIGENYAQIKAEVIRLMEQNPYFVKGEKFYVTMNGITSSAVEMEVIGQVTIENLEPCKHWIYEVIATQLEVYNTYEPDQENILILPSNTPSSNAAPDPSSLPMPGALPSTYDNVPPSNSNASPLKPLDEDLIKKLKSLDEPRALNHMENHLKSSLLGQLINPVTPTNVKDLKDQVTTMTQSASTLSKAVSQKVDSAPFDSSTPLESLKKEEEKNSNDSVVPIPDEEESILSAEATA